MSVLCLYYDPIVAIDYCDVTALCAYEQELCSDSDYGLQSRTGFSNPGIWDWRFCKPGIPVWKCGILRQNAGTIALSTVL